MAAHAEFIAVFAVAVERHGKGFADHPFAQVFSITWRSGKARSL